MPEFLRNLHLEYLSKLDKDSSQPSLSSFRAESLRMGGVFWALTSMRLLGVSLDEKRTKKIAKFVLSCFDENGGGFGWSTGHDSHIASTHYALLILFQLEVEIFEKKSKLINFVKSCQLDSGAFQADQWGESDIRFSYDAASILYLLGDREMREMDLQNFTHWILSCQNTDGGFGPVPGLESHAAYAFCAIAALRVAAQPIPLSAELAHWLAERQTPSGGFNGRPEKAPDVCYSWWILSSLEMLGKKDWIDQEALTQFILRAQEPTGGGIADRPDCVPDVFHTFFGMAGLALMGKFDLKKIDPRLVIPISH